MNLVLTIILSHMEICLDTKKTTTTSSTNIDTVGIESPRDELGEDNDFEEKKGSSSFFPGFSLLKKNTLRIFKLYG